ncbi:hypothetical protein U879_08740, partial [Defluviimonas sp. 20V17]
GGPPVIAYWLGSPEPHSFIRANIVGYFAVATVISVVSYCVGGLFVWHIVALCLPVGFAYASGLLLGARLFGLSGDAGFRWVSYALIAASGIGSLPIFDQSIW